MDGTIKKSMVGSLSLFQDNLKKRQYCR